LLPQSNQYEKATLSEVFFSCKEGLYGHWRDGFPINHLELHLLAQTPIRVLGVVVAVIETEPDAQPLLGMSNKSNNFDTNMHAALPRVKITPLCLSRATDCHICLDPLAVG